MIMYTRNSNNRQSANIHNEEMLKKQIAMNKIKNTPQNVDVSTKKNMANQHQRAIITLSHCNNSFAIV